jgi:hypothetical protein
MAEARGISQLRARVGGRLTRARAEFAQSRGGGPRLAQLVDRLVGLGHTPIDLSPRVMNSYIYGCR